MTYHREVREGDPLRFTTRLLAHDAKRIHYIHEMFHGEAGYLAATNELMSLHVSQATRRGAPMAPEILERLGRDPARARPAAAAAAGGPGDGAGRASDDAVAGRPPP